MGGIQQVSNPLWQSMCMFAFAWLVFSWVQAHKGKIDIFSSTRYIVFLVALLAMISFSKPIFINGTAMINNEAEQVSTGMETFLGNAGKAGIEGENDTFGISAPILGVLLDVAYYLAAVLRELLGFFQWGIIFLMYSVSPLLISFLAHPTTQSTGVRFLTTVFGIMMWKFGFIFADFIFIGAFDQMVSSYAVASGDLPLQQFTEAQVAGDVFLSIGMGAWLFIMLLILVFMYAFAPILTYLIFSGGSPAGAVGAAVGAAASGMAGFSKLMSSLSSSRKGLASAMSPVGASLSSAKGMSSPAQIGQALGSSGDSMMGLPSSEVNQRENSKNS